MSALLRSVCGAFLAALLFLAGCALPPRAHLGGEADHASWRGRLSLRIESEQTQYFAAGFELTGNAQAGELRLSSPLGNTLAALSWTAQTAVMRANGEVRHFDSLDALLAQATGAALPVSALFAWLGGDNASATGWQADLSQLGEGRLFARRTAPAPAAELRLILER